MQLLEKIKRLFTRTYSIPIKYREDDQVEIKKIAIGDWIDLCAARDYEYEADEFIKLDYGIAMQLPKGMEAWVAPRGSCFKNYGLIQTNSPGVVDNSFCGDTDYWFTPMYSLRNGSVKKGERVCQFRLMKKMRPIQFNKVEHLGNPDRGGHGSTGR